MYNLKISTKSMSTNREETFGFLLRVTFVLWGSTLDLPRCEKYPYRIRSYVRGNSLNLATCEKKTKGLLVRLANIKIGMYRKGSSPLAIFSLHLTTVNLSTWK